MNTLQVHEDTMTHPHRSELRASLGGTLRPGDPRRFFIEAMVGAMHADGSVDARELRVLRDLLERHDLFAALSGDVAQMLIDLSSDAISFAGGAVRRVPVIAGNLHWRHERLAAFAMACEVCAADQIVDDREDRYLVALRIALRLDEREHDALLAAAHAGRAMAWLEDETARTCQLLPVLAELLVLGRWRGSAVVPMEASELVLFLPRLQDLATTSPDAAELVDRARRRSGSWRSLDDEVAGLLCQLPFPCDRYWAMVYLLTDWRLRGQDGWASDPLLLRLASAFHYSELQMQLACEDAAQLVSLISC